MHQRCNYVRIDHSLQQDGILEHKPIRNGTFCRMDSLQKMFDLLKNSKQALQDCKDLIYQQNINTYKPESVPCYQL